MTKNSRWFDECGAGVVSELHRRHSSLGLIGFSPANVEGVGERTPGLIKTHTGEGESYLLGWPKSRQSGSLEGLDW